MHNKYNPEVAPNPVFWLNLDERERALEVEDYHRRKQIKAPNLTVHAMFHVMVENQIADEVKSVTKTMQRLTQQGLSRHDAIHAISSILIKLMSDKFRNGDAKGTQAHFDAELDHLTAQAWLNGTLSDVAKEVFSVDEENLAPGLSRHEIEELDDFLLSEEVPDHCMDFSTLDGFFAALVLHPSSIPPKEFMRWIWDMEQGREEPYFDKPKQAKRIIDLMQLHYHDVLAAIESGCFIPKFYELYQPDGSEFYDAESWCEGFLLGTALDSKPWEGLMDKHPEYLAPMVLLGTEEGWEELDEEEEDDIMQLTRNAYESIAESVKLIHIYFKEQRTPGTHKEKWGEMKIAPSSATKVGRNDACPCGSGKKFKKCCGSPVTLH